MQLWLADALKTVERVPAEVTVSGDFLRTVLSSSEESDQQQSSKQLNSSYLRCGLPTFLARNVYRRSAALAFLEDLQASPDILHKCVKNKIQTIYGTRTGCHKVWQAHAVSKLSKEGRWAFTEPACAVSFRRGLQHHSSLA